MKLLCHIEPFDTHQTVYLVNDDNQLVNIVGKYTQEDFVTTALDYCVKNDVSEVLFSGSVDFITEYLIHPMEQAIATKYSTNPITIKMINEV